MVSKSTLPNLSRDGVFFIVFSSLFCSLTTYYIYIFGAFPFDDAFIHMRIAKNLAEHGLPYFNLSEKIMGDSSTLWISVQALLFKIFGSAPLVIIWLAVALVLANYGLAVLVLSRAYGLWVSALIAATIITLYLTNSSAGLMEPPLIELLMLASVYSLQREKWAAFGFFAAMASITRFEYCVFLALAFLFAKDRRSFLKGALLPLLYFTIFNFWFYGTLIPQTVRAKSITYQVGADHFLRNFAFLGAEGFRYWLSLLLFVAALGWQGWSSWRKSTENWVALPFLFSFALFFLYPLRHTFMFPWYWANLIFPMTFAALATKAKGKWALVIVLALVSITRIERTREDWLGLFRGHYYKQSNVTSNLRVIQYIALAKELYRDYPSATLLTSEIGGLGWGFPGKVLDGMGLISPEVMKYHPLRVPEERSHPGIGAIPSGVVKEFQPDLIVSMRIFTEDFRRRFAAGEFKNYRLLKKIPVFHPESTGLGDGEQDAPEMRFIEVYARTGTAL